MAVGKRQTSRGETSEYHYRFMHKGTLYTGVCEGCFTKKDAEAHEKKFRKTITELDNKKSIAELFEYRRNALSDGVEIPIAEAFDRAMKKSSKRVTGDKFKAVKKSIWADFAAWMAATNSDVKHLAQVQTRHLENYLGMVQESGRFIKKRGSSERLSGRSLALVKDVLAEVFKRLRNETFISDRLFDGVATKKIASESRDVFTLDELALIFGSTDNLIRPLFQIGVMTALRLGDVCTLKWSDVDWNRNCIRRKTGKTKVWVEIPFIPQLVAVLKELKIQAGESEFVLPVQADMYLKKRHKIMLRIKRFLEKNGITTTKEIEGRSRIASVKNFHALRHTFCYLHSLNGTPLMVVKSIVGHMNKEMTEKYSSHANLEDKRRLMAEFSKVFGGYEVAAIPESAAAIPAPSAPAPLAGEYRAVPVELLNQLRVAADSGNLERIKEIVAELG